MSENNNENIPEGIIEQLIDFYEIKNQSWYEWNWKTRDLAIITILRELKKLNERLKEKLGLTEKEKLDLLFKTIRYYIREWVGDSTNALCIIDKLITDYEKENKK